LQSSAASFAGLLKPNEQYLLPLLPHESYLPIISVSHACGGPHLKGDWP
jgi:hypothetical protein